MIVTRSATPSRFGNAAAARAVHADRMDLVEIGQRAIAVGEVADRGDRGDVAVHRIDAFERDQLGRLGILLHQQLLEMVEVVVAEHALLAARVLDAGDHRGVVEFVGEDDAAGQQFAERRQRRLVRDVARGEQQRALLAVQVGELGLELDVVMGVAADVAGAARAGADVVQRFLHRRDHRGVLAHAEIVVRAPHGDRLGAVMAGEASRVGIAALGAQDVDEDAVAAFVVQPVDRRLEDAVVIQRWSRCSPRLYRGAAKAIANDSQLERADLVEPEARQRRLRAPGRGAAVNTAMPGGGAAGHGWPSVRCAMRRAMPGAAVDQRDAGRGGGKLLGEQREVGAGEHHRRPSARRRAGRALARSRRGPRRDRSARRASLASASSTSSALPWRMTVQSAAKRAARSST